MAAALEREQQRLEAEEKRTRLTAAEYYALRKQVRVDVETFLLEHGPDGVTDEMVQRWVGEATANCIKHMVQAIVNEPASPEALERARERIRAHLARTAREQEALANGTHAIAQHLPAAPSPAYVAKNGAKELDRLDIFVEINRLFYDANLMRESSIRVDPTGGEKVINLRMFDKSISRRLEILATSLSTQRELWDLQRMENFYNTIVETIAAAAPDVAREIQRRLAELNIRIGMT